jgi:hypothetical protein
MFSQTSPLQDQVFTCKNPMFRRDHLIGKLASLIPSAIRVETTQTFLDGCTLLTPPDCRIPSMVFLPTEAERIL